MATTKRSRKTFQADDRFEAIRCDSVLGTAIRDHSGKYATQHARLRHGQFFGKAFVTLAQCDLINGGKLYDEAWNAVERRIVAGKIVDAVHMAKSWLNTLKRNVKRDQGRIHKLPYKVPVKINDTETSLGKIPLEPKPVAPRMVPLSHTKEPVDTAPTPIQAAINNELAESLEWDNIRQLPVSVKVAWAFAQYVCDESKRHGADTYIAQFAILDSQGHVVDLQSPGSTPMLMRPSRKVMRLIRKLREEGLLQLREMLTRRGYSPE